jgi:hypothetical protein
VLLRRRPHRRRRPGPAEHRGEAISLASLSLYVGIGVGPLLGEAAIDRSGFPAPCTPLTSGWAGPGSCCWCSRPWWWGSAASGARIPDRLGAARATRIALAASAAGLVAGTVVFATGVALLTPAVITLAVQGVAPRERGAVIGTTSSSDLAIGLGPATLGLVAAAAGRLLGWRRPGRK